MWRVAYVLKFLSGLTVNVTIEVADGILTYFLSAVLRNGRLSSFVLGSYYFAAALWRFSQICRPVQGWREHFINAACCSCWSRNNANNEHYTLRGYGIFSTVIRQSFA